MYMVIGLVVLSGSQVLILKAQDILGSRFCIPRWFLPDYYNYHKTFHVDPDDFEICAICLADIIPSTENSKTINLKVQQGMTGYFALCYMYGRYYLFFGEC